MSAAKLNEHIRQRVSDVHALVELNKERLSSAAVEKIKSALRRTDLARSGNVQNKDALRNLLDRVESVADAVNNAIAPRGNKAGFSGVGDNMNGIFDTLDEAIRTSNRVRDKLARIAQKLTLMKDRFDPSIQSSFVGAVATLDAQRLNVKVAYERKQIDKSTAVRYLDDFNRQAGAIEEQVDMIIDGRKAPEPVQMPAANTSLPSLPGSVTQASAPTPEQAANWASSAAADASKQQEGMSTGKKVLIGLGILGLGWFGLRALRNRRNAA